MRITQGRLVLHNIMCWAPGGRSRVAAPTWSQPNVLMLDHVLQSSSSREPYFGQAGGGEATWTHPCRVKRYAQ
eukprot:4301315-Prorocentrum_lima.AAC.1